MRVYDRAVHPEASVYEGHEGFLRFAQTDWDAFDEVRYEPQDFVVHGEYVVVTIKQGGKGRAARWGSRRASSTSGSCAGKCVELRNYSTMGEALEAIDA